MGSDDNTVSPKGEPPDPRFDTKNCDDCGAMLPYENHLGGCSNDETTNVADNRTLGDTDDGRTDRDGGLLGWLSRLRGDDQ